MIVSYAKDAFVGVLCLVLVLLCSTLYPLPELYCLLDGVLLLLFFALSSRELDCGE